MNMNLNTNDNIQKNFSSVLEQDSNFDVKLETRMIMYRFLSEVERICDESDINRRTLAEGVGTSPSYITQLFRGNKILNLETIAKIQDYLKIKFDIKAVSDAENDYQYIVDDADKNTICSNDVSSVGKSQNRLTFTIGGLLSTSTNQQRTA